MFAFAEGLFGDSSPASSTLPAFFALFTVIPLLMVISSGGPVIVMGSQDITVHRMQHYDLQGVSKGSRNAAMNFEARTWQSPGGLARKCVLVRLLDLASKASALEELLTGQGAAGGLLVLLPSQENLKNIPSDDLDSLIQLEKTLLTETTQIPIYFAHETDDLREIYDDVESSQGLPNTKNGSAVQQLISSVFANGLQVVVSSTQTTPVKDPIMTNIEVCYIILLLNYLRL